MRRRLLLRRRELDRLDVRDEVVDALRAEHYGQALVMSRKWKAALAPFLAGIPVRTGFVGEMRFGLLNDVRYGEKKLPRMIDRMEQFGCGRAVVGLVIPTGYSFNLDGTCIYLTLGALYLELKQPKQATATLERYVVTVLVRDGQRARIPGREVVRGDVIVLAEGQVVEEGEADWLWQVDTNRRVRSASPRFAYALGRDPGSITTRPSLARV